jgi:branched-chain amino acid transport system ATP-binding protein
MLEVRNLNAWYGKSHILHGVDLDVGEGEIVSLLGRNGVGRSTTLLSLMGHVQASGSARLRGRELLGLKPFHIARLGLGYVPEGREIFPRLTVRENLMLGVKSGALKPRWTIDDFLRRFPILEERANEPAGVMSGGEQQMLTLARTLMGDPELVMIDEPTEGLAPRIVDQVAGLLGEIARRGIAILLVEQKLDIALRISQRVLVMGHGRIVHQSTPQELLDNAAVRQEWLGV